MAQLAEPTAQMYEELSGELHELSRAWSYVHGMTRNLFGTDTFRRAAAPYFDVVLRALFQYGVVLLSRLLDRAQTGCRENCSLAALARSAGSAEHAASLDEIRIRASNLLEYRNKQVAHLDRMLMLQADEERPQLFTWVGMHETLQALQRWLNKFEAAMGLDQERYLVEEEWSDVDEVAQLLRKGMSA